MGFIKKNNEEMEILRKQENDKFKKILVQQEKVRKQEK